MEERPREETARAERQAPPAPEPEPAARVPGVVLDAQAAAMAARAAIANGDWAAAEEEAERLDDLKEPLENLGHWGETIMHFDRGVDSLEARVERRDQAGALQAAEEVEAAIATMMSHYTGPNDVSGQP